MVKTNGTTKPGKVEKAKKKAKEGKATAKKVSSRSQEYVVDSDNEDAAPEDRAVKKVNAPTKSNGRKAVKAVKKEPSVSEEEEAAEEDAEEDINVKQAMEPDDSDSDSDHSQASAALRKPEGIPAKVNGVKRSATESDGSEEEEDEDELPDLPPVKKSKRESTSPMDVDGEDNKEAEPSASKSATREEVPIESIPIQPYRAPAGYVALGSNALPSSSFIRNGSKANKQIWHITAPSDVSLSSLTEFALDSLQSSKPVMTYRGTDYILKEDDTMNEHESVLVPSAGSFTSAQVKISKTLHLQQKITLPNLSNRQASQVTGGDAAANVGRAAVSTIKTQPKGLRMRYKPSGFGSGAPGAIGSGSESADDDEPKKPSSSFQFPTTLGAHGVSENHTAAPDVEAPQTKKTKKKRKDKTKDLIAEDAMDVDAKPASTMNGVNDATAEVAAKPPKTVTAPKNTPPANATQINGDTVSKLTKEEKAKRKEEKRLKREKKEAKVKTEQLSD